MKRKQKNQNLQACLLGLLFFVLVFSFVLSPNQAQALGGDYNKAINGTLAASEWNNLVNDFVAKSGSRLDGYFSINTATSSTYALDISGALRATSIEGSYTGLLNAANISSGQFGANAGYGNFSFPGNVGIGTTNPGASLEIGTASSTGNYVKVVGSNSDNTYDVFRGERKYPRFTLKDTIAGGAEFNFWNLGGQMRFGTNTGGVDTAGFVVNSGARPIVFMSGNLALGPYGNDGLTAPRNVSISVNRPYSTYPVSAGSLTLQAAGATPTATDNNGGVLSLLSGISTGSGSSYITFNTATAGSSGATDNNPTEKMRILGNGNVGIGTTTAAEKLTVQTNATSGEQTALTLRHALTGAGDNVAIRFWPAGGYSGMTLPGKIVATAPAGNNIGFNFVTNNNGVANTAVSILPNGYVGIGTTTPGSTLDVNGLIKMRTALITANDDVVNKGYLDSALASTTAQIITQVSTSSFWQGSMAGAVYNSNAGNVGIGTSTPTAKLHILGGFKIDSSNPVIDLIDSNGVDWKVSLQDNHLSFLGNDGVTEYIRFNNGGNVGIGTTAPVSKLTMFGANPRLSIVHNVLNVGDTGIDFILNPLMTAERKNAIIVSAAGSYGRGNMSFVLDSALDSNNYDIAADTKMTILNNGNVGIGTTNPTAKLYVNGTSIFNDVATFTQPVVVGAPVLNTHAATKNYVDSLVSSSTGAIAFWGGALGGNLWNLNTGNVGIGTTAPGAKLELAQSGDTEQSGLRFTRVGATRASIALSAASGNLEIARGGTSLISVGTNNVGISITSPREGLDVATTTRIGIDGKLSMYSVSGGSCPGCGTEAVALQTTIDNRTVADGLPHPGAGSDRHILALQPAYGYVGIGTTTPGTKLTVVGAGNYSIDAGNYRVGNVATPVAALDAVNKSYLDSAVGAAQTAFWNINGSNLYASSTNWNVGVGTTAPDSRLHIVGTGQPLLHLQNSNGTDGITAGILFGVTGAADYQQAGIFFERLGGSAEGSLHFATKNGGAGNATKANARMTINAGGNVGIGTTNPGAKLELSVGNVDGINIKSSNSGFIRLFGGGTTTNWGIANDYNTGNYFEILSGALAANPTTRRLAINGSNGDVMIPGNVGIGTTTPGTRLTVVGSGNYSIDAGNYRVGNVATPVAALDAVNKSYLDSAISTSQTTFWNINGSNLYASSTSWNVGIGLTNPSARLHIGDDTQTALKIGSTQVSIIGETDDVTYPGMKVNAYNGNIHFGISSTTNTKLNIWHAGSNYMYIQQATTTSIISNYSSNPLALQMNGGNVGIGITNPTARLYVNGTSIFNDVATFTQPVIVGTPVLNAHAATKNYVDSLVSSSTGAIAFWGGSLASNVWSLNSGNIGIGTTTPATKLQIESSTAYHQLLQKRTGSNQALWSGAVWDSVGSFIGNNSYYSSSFNYIPNYSAASGLEFRESGNIEFFADSGLTSGVSYNPTERMVINTSGNVGIGTMSPNSRLHLYNTAANAEIDIQSLVGAGNHWGTYSNLSDNSYRIWGGSDYLTILRSGNVGIGTTAPGAYRLFVNGNTNVAGSVTASSFVGPLTGTISAGNVSSGDFGASTGGGVYSFPSDVGMGLDVTHPSARLEVKNGGEIFVRTSGLGRGDEIFGFEMVRNSGIWGEDARGFRIYRDKDLDDVRYNFLKIDATNREGAIENILSIDGDNRFVGIGTTNPGNKLDIAGDARIVYPSLQLKLVDSDDSRTWGLNVNAGVFSIYDQTNSASPLTITGVNPTGTLYLLGGNVGIGTTAPGAYRLKVAGDMAVTGTLQTQTGSDFAEEFSVTEDLAAGTVVVMSDQGHKSVKAASSAYDRTVIGIVSDNPSIIAGKVDSEKKVVVAMMGVVSVKASSANGRIHRGDLLTSADLNGYAMKASEFKPGTIIGKALEDLNGSSGQIKVLVNLQ